jgi:hypothetical protein
VVRLRWDEQPQAYADVEQSRGSQNRREILRCLKRFIAREVFRILMGGCPAVRLKNA